MITMELEARKTSIIRQILDVNDDKSLQQIEKWIKRHLQKEPETSAIGGGSFTLTEMNEKLDRAEADISAGRTYTSKQVFDMMEDEFPYLCK